MQVGEQPHLLPYPVPSMGFFQPLPWCLVTASPFTWEGSTVMSEATCLGFVICFVLVVNHVLTSPSQKPRESSLQ